MVRLNLRIDDALADDLRVMAARRGESVNAMATTAFRALTDPHASGRDIQQIRERLARAGLLNEPAPEPAPRPCD
jgi:plasmid stability protein